MATPLKVAPTIDFARVRQQIQARTESDPHDTPQHNEERYRLLSRLQTTLELNDVLALFYRELEDRLGLDGMRYVHEARQLQQMLGSNASHSCGYRLMTKDGDYGELLVYRSRRFSEEELSSIEFLISTLLHPLRNALQYLDAVESSLRDPLTGAGNRIALDNTLDREIRLARRYQQPLSLLVIDIDRFKQVNDTHGHSAGDRILQDLVRLLINVHRSTDSCFRFGGEEFVIVLNRTDTEGATIIAERLRHAVEATPLGSSDNRLGITVSIGIAVFRDNDTVDSLFDRADRALYAIKKTGGNRVTRDQSDKGAK